MNIGRQFEEDLAREFGLNRVPGSGNQLHSKLDVSGKGARWSLKATHKKSITLTQEIIDEALEACLGLNGDGSVPIWALRIETSKYDLVVLTKDDFKALQRGDLNVINSERGKEKVEERRRRASVPTLLQDGN